MDQFCLSSRLVGSELHLVVSNNNFTTVINPPEDIWFLSGTYDLIKPLCLDSLLRLKGIILNVAPQNCWSKSMSIVAPGLEVPWAKVMPMKAYKDFIKNLIKSIVDLTIDLPKDYYNDVWRPCGQFLTKLKPAKVNSIMYKSLMTNIVKDSGAFETFKPGLNEFLPIAIYDRFATRTGRLTISSGPNILTLKKEYRSMLKSSFSDGVICSLDFGSLEARIILAESKKDILLTDLYELISNELFDGKVDRKDIKIAIISELYGASKTTIGQRLGLSGFKLKEFIETIRSYFGTVELRKRLKNEYIATGNIKNRFGRPLDLDVPQDHLFINTFSQSTGVDVSLLGFKKVIDDLGCDGIRPLFVLHDALILDVRSDRIEDVKNYTAVSIPTYDSQFPLKYEKV